MLTIGIDSYVSVAEANEIVEKYFTSTNDMRTKWSALSDSDKESLLRHSCRSINNLKFSGRRATASQQLEFPRVQDYGAVGIGFRPWISQTYDNSIENEGFGGDGLNEAKQAQVVNAVYHGYMDKLSVETTSMNIRGLTSKKAGPIAESYSANQNNTYNRDMQIGIFTKEVYSILTPWVSTSRLGM